MKRTLITGFGAVVLLAAALAAAPSALAAPSQALASSSCYDNGHTIKYVGNTYHEYQCTTYKTGYTYNDQTKVGVLNAGSNWMACQWNFGSSYPNPVVGTATNTWWEWTKGDRVVHEPSVQAWGWFPATYVSQGGNNAPVPGVAKCGGPGGTTPPVKTGP